MSEGQEPQGYRRLLTWQSADELAHAVFKALDRSKVVRPWLRDQVCRAAVSVPANIAEGYSRGSLREYIRFLDIARGSLGETEYFIQFLIQEGLLAGSAAEPIDQLITETGKRLFALIKSLERKDQTGTWNRHQSIHEEQEGYGEFLEEPDSISGLSKLGS